MSLQNVPSFFLDFSERDMKGENGHSYGFGRFTLDVAEQRLSDGESPVPLTPKAFDVLSLLVQNAGHLVEKEELMKHVWPDSFVEESNVARIVHTLRKRLGDDGDGNSFIETVPTKGYRFVAHVEELDGPPNNTGKNSKEIESIADIVPYESDTAVNTGTREKGVKWRKILVPVAIVILFALVTGFWISNGSFLPRPLSAGLSKHSPNGQAYVLFQQARQLVETHKAENYKQALEDFEKAIEIDPYYAEAYAGKADVRSLRSIETSANDDITTARSTVKKALELDPDNSYGHTINCRIIGTNDWEFEEAVSECQHAVELDPNDAAARRELGFALNAVGRQNEALAEMEMAVALSPTSNNKVSLGMIYTMSRRYDEAIDELKQVDATDPGVIELVWLMRCFMIKNDPANAFGYFIRAQEMAGTDPEGLTAIKAAFVTGGWPAAVRVALDTPTGLQGKRSILVAILLTRIGEKDRAFEVLDDLRRRRSIIFVTVARDPIFDPLHDDPRYDAILSQTNLK